MAKIMLGAPSLDGKGALEIVTEAFNTLEFPREFKFTNFAGHAISLPGIPLYLQFSGHEDTIAINSIDVLHGIAVDAIGIASFWGKTEYLEIDDLQEVAAITTTEIASLVTDEVISLSTQTIAALASEQVSALTTEQIASLSTSDVASLITADIADLNTVDAKVEASKTIEVETQQSAEEAAVDPAPTETQQETQTETQPADTSTDSAAPTGKKAK